MTERAAALREAGMSAAEAERKAESFDRIDAALAADGATAGGRRSYWVPGRIEFLGKHTDYAGGRSILAAVERGFCVVAAPRDDNRLQLRDLRSGEVMSCLVHPALGGQAGHWSNYAMTVARRIARNFPGPCRGADIVFASDLPPAAGLSSSSALVVAVFLALADLNDLPARQEFRRNIHGNDDLAGYLGCVENGGAFEDLSGDAGVGTNGGSQDQTAILQSRAGALIQYAFAPVRFERVLPLPPGHRFVIAASGVRAEKAGAARRQYNRAAAGVAAILELSNRTLGRADASLATALGADGARIADLAGRSSVPGFEGGALARRLEQFMCEDAAVLAAGDALLAGDLTALGRIVDRSQECAERLLGNQIEETIALARSARELGAAAASAFGAGFGGSVWALIPDAGTEAFMAAWAARYRGAFPAHGDSAEFFSTGAGPAALRL